MVLRELEDFEELMYECFACNGAGSYSIGDCEDGVDELCNLCEGSGLLDYEEGERDIFVPERDALTPSD